MVRRPHTQDPVLITTAPKSSDDEYERRRVKYAIMMALRALAVIAAALTYRISIWIALAFVVAGMVLPWCAVIIANDRPAKKRHAHLGYVQSHPERALPPGDDGRVVDG